MAVYRPKRNGTASKFYVCEFVLHGKRIQESTGSTSRTVAKEYEKRRRAELERAAAGLPTERKAPRLRTVTEVADSYVHAYKVNHRPKSIVFADGCLRQVKRLLGNFLLSDLTLDRVRSYIRQRQAEGASGRTINMELGELSRAIGGTWRELWPKLKKLEERKDIGQALSPEEQDRLLNGLEQTQSPILRTIIPTLLLTGMRSGEAMTLTWGQVDLLGRTITVGRAKTASGTGRVIPINDELAHSLAAHRAWFVDRFGEPDADHYFFPWGSSESSDPCRHATTIKRSWGKLRKWTGVSCRLHDLRHTFATGLAERGVSESTMLALMGHMSRAMLERYSHIRMTAKREAVAGATLRTKGATSEPLPVKVPVLEQALQIQ
jgi:integrase